MSLTDVIGVFGTGTYTVTRTAAGARTLGRYAPGATSTFTIAASVQPLTGREIKALPEGDHADEHRVVYTTTELRTLMASVGAPDSVSIDGEAWDVARVEKWPGPSGTTHYRARVSRKARP